MGFFSLMSILNAKRNATFYESYENLEMIEKNGKHKLVGFVNLGNSHDVMSQLTGTVVIMIYD